eukprot:TRINITY_DN18943_c0_g1_i1.p1 TRINITY_DN18943_c0_g1~~TRINITY_DN18943_c0_g1_i1.p1  ORF type:complete len:326 (+),score=78.41 TRINITY_DN18943_c0_g1_i1:168-1145(+)
MKAVAAMLKPRKTTVVAVVGSGTALWWCNRTPLPAEAPAGTDKPKTVLVTGGTNGLGFATVKRLSERGDLVLTCGRDPKRVAAVNELPNVRAFVCDLSKEKAMKDLIGKVSAELKGKPLDVLINNAGVQRHGDPILEERSLEKLDEAWAANVRAPVMLTQKLWPLLRPADAPIIINVGSTCCHQKFAGAFFLGYPVTKGALAAFSNTLRQETALVHPTAKVVHFKTGAFQTNLTSDPAQKAAANLRSYGPPFDKYADTLYKKQEEAFAILSPGRAEDFADAVAAVVHPVSGESSLLMEYQLNVSLLERIVPWLPQSVLDGNMPKE